MGSQLGKPWKAATPDFGTWNDNAADNSRMFLRDVSTQNLYTLDVDFP